MADWNENNQNTSLCSSATLRKTLYMIAYVFKNSIQVQWVYWHMYMYQKIYDSVSSLALTDSSFIQVLRDQNLTVINKQNFYSLVVLLWIISHFDKILAKFLKLLARVNDLPYQTWVRGYGRAPWTVVMWQYRTRIPMAEMVWASLILGDFWPNYLP